MSTLFSIRSWIICDKETKQPLFETFNPAIPKKLNTDKYVAIDALTWLQSINAGSKAIH